MDHPGQVGERPGGGKAAGQVVAHRRLVQPRERDFATVSMHFQVVLGRLERILPGQRLARPVRAENQNARRPRAPRQIGQPIHRRGIAPVEVLEAENQGDVHGHHLHGLGQLATPASRRPRVNNSAARSRRASRAAKSRRTPLDFPCPDRTRFPWAMSLY
jgi:hypothetical protein